MTSTSWIEISRSALLHNADFFQRQSRVKYLLAVIKGNAYGHDQDLVVGVLNKSRAITGYQVFELEEALHLRPLTTKPIAVLGFLPEDKALLKKAAQNKITLPIINPIWAKRIEGLGVPITVQIKIDIGTHRLGLSPEEGMTVIKRLSRNKKITISGVYAHFADSENDDASFTTKQSSLLSNFLAQLKAHDYNFPLSHAACSAALAKRVAPHLPAGRLGLGLYGLSPIDAKLQQRLRPALSWKTTVMQTLPIPAGDYIGYARTYRSPRAITIATIPVGYYDGFSRALSNKAQVLIRNKRCPVRGNICMNVSMIEVPRRVRVGDEVVLIGHQGKQKLTASDLADQTNTISYEMVTRLRSTIPRFLVP